MPRQDGPLKAWGTGIAGSRDLVEWRKAGEIQPEGELEQKGICAPGVLRLDGRLHMVYQTYEGGAKDSICHAVSEDELKCGGTGQTRSSAGRGIGTADV